ncbi:MAG: hypothetical protein M1831_005926 [Alyxoria varia]|nr:MAG: hypothetical protein M1831_005926 [Alyxoria varia]
MPEIVLPPTPASSTEIKAKQDDVLASHKPFDLPPSAMSNAGSNSSNLMSRQSTLEELPISSSFPHHPAPVAPKPSDASTKPCKIIQMKTRKSSARAKEAIKEGVADAEGSSRTGAGSKRKPASSSTAGKKVARKTAHSLIERRRRSKMNDEFDELRKMIPGCADQEMHKLAILQAANDHVRRLSSSVDSKLDWNRTGVATCTGSSALNQNCLEKGVQQQATTTPATIADAGKCSCTVIDQNDRCVSRSHHTDCTGASLMASGFSQHTEGSSGGEMVTEPTSSLKWHESESSSHGKSLNSPTYPTSSSWFGSTKSTEAQDHEASAALLMLNASDRRSRVQISSGESAENGMDSVEQTYVAPPRAISVRDLLSA